MSALKSFLMDGREVMASPENLIKADQDLVEHYNEEEELGDYDIDDDETCRTNNMNADDISPEMSEVYYRNLESFLSRPPPTIGKSKVKDANLSLPKLKEQRAALQQELRFNRAGGTDASKVRRGKVPKKAFDENLLRQAMEYTEKLTRQNLEDDTDEEEEELGANRKAGGSAPSNGSAPLGSVHEDYPSTAPTRKGGKDGSRNGNHKIKNKKTDGLVSKLRLQTRIVSGREGGFEVPTEQAEDIRKAALDFDALVANFEHGLTLQKLQAELSESKRAMAKSEEVMRRMAAEMGVRVKRR